MCVMCVRDVLSSSAMCKCEFIRIGRQRRLVNLREESGITRDWPLAHSILLSAQNSAANDVILDLISSQKHSLES